VVTNFCKVLINFLVEVPLVQNKVIFKSCNFNAHEHGLFLYIYTHIYLEQSQNLNRVCLVIFMVCIS
jgi:hypothetical protein